jgi:hypothetical protein
MRKIIPYKTHRNALAALDNGGRFYNLLTKPADGEIAKSELAKLAGAFTDHHRMFLFLEMALAELDEVDTRSIIGALSSALRAQYRKHRPAHLTPAEALQKGKPAKPLIVTGTPRYVKSNSDFVGFIMVPIAAGKVTTFAMIPIIDQYDVYEVRDQATDEVFLIAHARSKNRLPQNPIRFAGVLKKLQPDKTRPSAHKVFLEVLFYSPTLA